MYLDYLSLTQGRNNLPSEFQPDLRSIDWKFDLRINALWDSYEDLSLLVAEPSGEAVFYDNFQSDNGGLYMSQYHYDNGPDEYLNINSVSGKYDVYIVRTTDVTEFSNYPSTQVKVKIALNFGRENEITKSFFINVPTETGVYKVTSVLINQD